MPNSGLRPGRARRGGQADLAWAMRAGHEDVVDNTTAPLEYPSLLVVRLRARMGELDQYGTDGARRWRSLLEVSYIRLESLQLPFDPL